MIAKVRRLFDDGDLVPRSRVSEVPHIKEFLANGLRREFAPRMPYLTLSTFARRIAALDRETLKRRLQRALQNARANECVDGYHVRDINLLGWQACIALIKVMHRGHDGHGLGQRFAFDPSTLRAPPARSGVAKRSACMSKRVCRRTRGAIYHQGLCMPRNPRVYGFEGVGKRSGQRSSRRTRSSRGRRHVAHPSGYGSWRRAGSVRRL